MKEVVNLRHEIADRACAACENARAITLQAALSLSPAAAWTVARMEADRNGIEQENHPFFWPSELRDHLINQIHDAIGTDSTLSENGLIRLTPLGRIRIRTAIGEPVL
jgi:hypothetical protein